ncbi:MAG: hypothetical protein MO846_06750 [Candidatus Devosia symbiotica]|nr:hypothetical protein [Candidatus Devosia symbiotica]
MPAADPYPVSATQRSAHTTLLDHHIGEMGVQQRHLRYNIGRTGHGFGLFGIGEDRFGAADPGQKRRRTHLEKKPTDAGSMAMAI